MFGFITGILSMLANIFPKFKKFFTKPQYRNFCRTMTGLIVTGEGEHDMKSINELFIDRKDQSILNRFITASKWDIEAVAREGVEFLLGEAEHDPDTEIKIIDETRARRWCAITIAQPWASSSATTMFHPS